jgi:hypothetical protein
LIGRADVLGVKIALVTDTDLPEVNAPRAAQQGGLAALEAMASSLPVIAANAGARPSPPAAFAVPYPVSLSPEGVLDRC